MSIEKVVITFSKLITIFFIIYIINFFFTLYSIYTYFDMKFFHNLQGSKLKIKQNNQKRRYNQSLNLKNLFLK